MKINIKGLGHMTKMATTLIYSKNLSKIFFYRTSGQIALKLCISLGMQAYYGLYKL